MKKKLVLLKLNGVKCVFLLALIYMASKVTNGHLGQTLSFDWPLFFSPVFGDYFDQIKWPGARGLVKQNFLTFLCMIMLMAFTEVSREVAWPGAAWHIEGLTSRIITTASCVNNTYKQHTSHWFSSRGRLGGRGARLQSMVELDEISHMQGRF